MLYICSANQLALTTGRPARISRGKGNPMKANARHVPGPTGSCRTPLSRSATPGRRSQALPAKCVHYADKMRPNFKTQIVIRLLSNTTTATSKSVRIFVLSSTLVLPLFVILILLLILIGPIQSHCFPFLPLALSASASLRLMLRSIHANKLSTTVQNGTKRDEFHISQKPTTLYQRLTTTPPPVSHFASNDCRQ